MEEPEVRFEGTLTFKIVGSDSTRCVITMPSGEMPAFASNDSTNAYLQVAQKGDLLTGEGRITEMEYTGRYGERLTAPVLEISKITRSVRFPS